MGYNTEQFPALVLTQLVRNQGSEKRSCGVRGIQNFLITQSSLELPTGFDQHVFGVVQFIDINQIIRDGYTPFVGPGKLFFIYCARGVALDCMLGRTSMLEWITCWEQELGTCVSFHKALECEVSTRSYGLFKKRIDFYSAHAQKQSIQLVSVFTMSHYGGSMMYFIQAQS